MEIIKILGVLVATAIMFTSCGTGGPLTGPTDVHRGEADAIDPARNVTVICEKNKNQNTDVTVNITNNCNKDNNQSSNSGAPE